ncbi:MAG TPA: FAD binding domain-containing protein [Planctomycetota bacterium]|jgi:xanthine dehydrogenase YagS FAD-binding subunit|nr:FAD binding domain-containing protein [Planctomycetota bacterium]
MRAFAYALPRSLEEAREALREVGSVPKAGGVDLLDHLKERLVAPDTLVSLRAVPGLDRIEERDGSIRIGALVTLARIAEDPAVRALATALASAAGDAATPQIRNLATAGGNLAQKTRCWYYRNRDLPCLKRGGSECPALDGRNRYHAILAYDRCPSVHASNLAPALLALGARVRAVGEKGGREIAIDDFFVNDPKDLARENVLTPGELITEVIVPASGLRSAYREVREKQSFDWPLVSAAASVRLENGRIADLRVALGAVAPVPLRAREVEEALRGTAPDPAAVRAAASRAFAGARPLAENEFKLPAGIACLSDAILAAIGPS